MLRYSPRAVMPTVDNCVWFYLNASANQTKLTRQHETRRKDESRRIKMNRTLQDESRRIKMNRTLQDESRRIKMNRTLQDESKRIQTHWAGRCGRFDGRLWPKRAETRTNPREFALDPPTHWPVDKDFRSSWRLRKSN